MITKYYKLKQELKENKLLINDVDFNYELNELINYLTLDIEDFLYSHIEWEHIELDAKTDDLKNLELEELIELALNYNY
jgi:hypothetical protein